MVLPKAAFATYKYDITTFKGEIYEKSEVDAYIRKLKYKRCVAMEKMCRDNYVFRKSLSDEDQWYWRRWHKRWQVLAEQFKE